MQGQQGYISSTDSCQIINQLNIITLRKLTKINMRQRWEIRTCEAVLKSLSTAAELDSVELIFVKATA